MRLATSFKLDIVVHDYLDENDYLKRIPFRLLVHSSTQQGLGESDLSAIIMATASPENACNPSCTARPKPFSPEFFT